MKIATQLLAATLATATFAGAANAASLDHAATTQLNNSGDSFAVSVVAGDSKFKTSTALGEVTGAFGDGTLLDWRVETGTNGDNPFAGGTVTDGGSTYFDVPTSTEVVYSPQNWLKVYTSSDIDVAGFGGADITSGTVPMVGSSANPLNGNIDISNLSDGQFYMVAGSYSQNATLTITMTGAGQPDLTDVQVVSPGGNNNRLHAVEWTFDNTGGLYDNISYQYNGGGSLSRRRYGGVFLDGNVVPEPSSIALLALGGLVIARRRRHA